MSISLGELGDRFVHLDEAVAFLLKLILHELRIDEEIARLHRAGHQHAGGIEDAAATGGQRVLGVLLAFGAIEGVLPAVGLQEDHAARSTR